MVPRVKSPGLTSLNGSRPTSQVLFLLFGVLFFYVFNVNRFSQNRGQSLSATSFREHVSKPGRHGYVPRLKKQRWHGFVPHLHLGIIFQTRAVRVRPSLLLNGGTGASLTSAPKDLTNMGGTGASLVLQNKGGTGASLTSVVVRVRP